MFKSNIGVLLIYRQFREEKQKKNKKKNKTNVKYKLKDKSFAYVSSDKCECMSAVSMQLAIKNRNIWANFFKQNCLRGDEQKNNTEINASQRVFT